MIQPGAYRQRVDAPASVAQHRLMPGRTTTTFLFTDPEGSTRLEQQGGTGGFAEALRRFLDTGDVSGYTLVLDALAALALRVGDRLLVGDRLRAARIAGAVALRHSNAPRAPA